MRVVSGITLLTDVRVFAGCFCMGMAAGGWHAAYEGLVWEEACPAQLGQGVHGLGVQLHLRTHKLHAHPGAHVQGSSPSLYTQAGKHRISKQNHCPPPSCASHMVPTNSDKWITQSLTDTPFVPSLQSFPISTCRQPAGHPLRRPRVPRLWHDERGARVRALRHHGARRAPRQPRLRGHVQGLLHAAGGGWVFGAGCWLQLVAFMLRVVV